MARKKPGVYETLQYVDAHGNVVKERKAKWLGECPNENVFVQSVNALQKKMEQKHLGRMNMVDRIVDEPTKVSIKISMVITLVYDEIWTYEWVK